LLCVQWKSSDDGQRNSPKHLEFYSKNKFEKLVHLVGFITTKLKLNNAASIFNIFKSITLHYSLDVLSTVHFVDIVIFFQQMHNICYQFYVSYSISTWSVKIETCSSAIRNRKLLTYVVSLLDKCNKKTCISAFS